jgi:DNA-directed RNA polymerase specialized sigma24 family protein
VRTPEPAASAGAIEAEFETFAAEKGGRLKRVLIAHFGVDIGNEVAADALAYAWQHWDRVREMANPLGYLYRVGQSSARRHWRWRRAVHLPREEPIEVPLPEPGLDAALASLNASQRVAVLLVHALGWTYEETAVAMAIPLTSVRNHVHRGMKRLRRRLGED